MLVAESDKLQPADSVIDQGREVSSSAPFRPCHNCGFDNLIIERVCKNCRQIQPPSTGWATQYLALPLFNQDAQR